MNNLNVTETEVEEIEEYGKDFSKMSLNEKLNYVSKGIGKIGKKNVPGVNYKVATADLIIDPVKFFMDKVGIVPHVNVIDAKIIHDTEPKFETVYDNKTKHKTKVPITLPNGEIVNKKTHLVSLNLKIVLENIHNENDKKEYFWFATGSNQEGDEAKGFGSALTYSIKYFYRTLFNISGNDDPDEFIDNNIIDDRVKKNDIKLIKKEAEVIGISGEELENTVSGMFEKSLDEITYREYNVLKAFIEKRTKINKNNNAPRGNNNVNNNNQIIIEYRKRVSQLQKELNCSSNKINELCQKKLGIQFNELNVEQLGGLINFLESSKKNNNNNHSN